jgi:hypothetical protein
MGRNITEATKGSSKIARHVAGVAEAARSTSTAAPQNQCSGLGMGAQGGRDAGCSSSNSAWRNPVPQLEISWLKLTSRVLWQWHA